MRMRLQFHLSSERVGPDLKITVKKSGRRVNRRRTTSSMGWLSGSTEHLFFD